MRISPSGQLEYFSPPLTRRDLFAAAALQGHLAHKGRIIDYRNIWEAADAMLKADEEGV
jgi:hypothetical protein